MQRRVSADEWGGELGAGRCAWRAGGGAARDGAPMRVFSTCDDRRSDSGVLHRLSIEKRAPFLRLHVSW